MSDRPDNLAPEEVEEVPSVILTADPTDADLDLIEDSILEELIAEEALVVESHPTSSAGRPPRKEKLIEDIEKFRGACPDIVQANWKLKKTRVADLEIVLARCVSAASGHPLRPGTAAARTAVNTKNRTVVIAPTDDIEEETDSDPRLDAPGLNGKTVAGTMCDLNILAMEMAEFGTQVAAPYTNGFIVDGASQELRDREAELEDIIRNVYADNKAICDKFVSPMLAWSSMMAFVALRNVKKIDETSGEVLSAQEVVARQKARAADTFCQ